VEFKFEVGQNEKHEVQFSRNRHTARIKVLVDNEEVASQNPLNLATHISFKLTKRFEFPVGSQEKHLIRIEHIRPLLVAGFRKHLYRIFIDELFYKEYYGY
jgi:hypothetical protein